MAKNIVGRKSTVPGFLDNPKTQKEALKAAFTDRALVRIGDWSSPTQTRELRCHIFKTHGMRFMLNLLQGAEGTAEREANKARTIVVSHYKTGTLVGFRIGILGTDWQEVKRKFILYLNINPSQAEFIRNRSKQIPRINPSSK